MGTLRFALALAISKLIMLFLSITPLKDSDLGGRIVLKISPDFLERVEKPAKIVAIMGTNGKDTVANLVASCVRATEIQVLSNSSQSANEAGIVAALVKGVSLFGREKYGTAVFQIEEKSIKNLFTWLEPDILLINNLVRESTEGKGHPEYPQEILTHYIPAKTKLIINGDDIMACGVAPSNSRKYFGVAGLLDDKKRNTNLIDDHPLCPKCHNPLAYEYNRYSNLGKAYCPACGYRFPGYDYTGEILNEKGKSLVVNTETRSESFPILHDTIYDIYNQVAAISVLLEMGVKMMDIKNAMGDQNILEGRFDVVKVGDITITSIMCKEENAYVMSRALETIMKDPGDKEVLIFNNDLEEAEISSENISWYYDCDFELLSNERVKRIVVYGRRSWDLKLRLLLAGVPEERISGVKEYDDAAEVLDYFDNDNIYILYGSKPGRVGKIVTDRIVDLASAKKGGEILED
ncbi:MAG: DUF1727 domain-containing protein [Firmicutes bacterium]|nr:DUF1727 domain-containing protein [Bacillota bacterium]